MIMQHFFTLVMMKCTIIIVSQFQKTLQTVMHVQSNGMRPVQADDTALVFYFKIQNNSGYKLSDIRLQMKHCCIHQHDGQKDCTSMRLLGDHLEMLPNGQSVKLSMVFPTLYPMGLEGHCVVTVSCHETSPLEHKFLFSTPRQSAGFINTLKGSTELFFPLLDTKWCTASLLLDQVIPASLNRACETIDLDPQRSCEPVNCPLKYHGLKNYFNTVTRLCEKPVLCVSTNEHDLPDKAFRLEQNRCELLEEKLKQSDVREDIVEDIPPIYEDYAHKHLVRYVCDHGQVKVTGEAGCDCDKDWTTDHKRMNGLVRYMCNVRRTTATQPPLAPVLGSDKDVVMVSTLGSACGVIVLFLIALLLVWVYRHKKSTRENAVQMHYSSTDKLLQETSEQEQTTRYTGHTVNHAYTVDQSTWQDRKVHRRFPPHSSEYFVDYTNTDVTEDYKVERHPSIK